MSVNKTLLLVNLGTPDDPSPQSVGRYLRQFLMDPLVLDIPAFFRWLLVHLIIVPFRSKKSAHAYQQIWGLQDSPLRIHTKDLAGKVNALVSDEFSVHYAMRYGQPSIESALSKIKDSGVKEIYVLPLYPQFALSSTQSTKDEVKSMATNLNLDSKIYVLSDFFGQKDFIECFVENCQKVLDEFKPDHLLFSFHGLPLRHCQKTVNKGFKCNQIDCCKQVTTENRYCYKAQCFTTASLIAQKLHLDSSMWSVSFQSRLGSDEWIKPFTDQVIVEKARQGIGKMAVACPSFVADCLETLEEIAIRGKQDFLNAGGNELVLIPSLNSSPQWAKAIEVMLKSENNHYSKPEYPAHSKVNFGEWTQL